MLIGVYERQDPLRIGFLIYNTFEKYVMYDEDHEATANFFADDLQWSYGQTKQGEVVTFFNESNLTIFIHSYL